MCAIAGLLGAKPGQLLPWLRGMTSTLRHRGPDDEGHALFGASQVVCLGGRDTPRNVYDTAMDYRPIGKGHPRLPPDAFLALGHRRLSILDLSPAGHQPMSYQKRYWIVYNGEVYNYLELRGELEKQGYRFHSRTDTEVILAAYACWGPDCLTHFNGMWAMAIFDTREQTLFLARDRFGVKPLYYWIQHDLFAFASEIKALAELPGWKARVNGQATYDFLTYALQDHSRETLFAGVYQLEPGARILIRCRDWLGRNPVRQQQAVEEKRWYCFQPASFAGSFDEAADRFRELLTDSVRLRLRSDVPVGSCLSGGLDSSSIVCVANGLLRQANQDYHQATFSACSEIKRYDERAFIEPVVAATGVLPHYVFPSLEDLWACLEHLLWQQDEPFASASIYAQWKVFEAAGQKKMKVMLDGQGADELLYGYPGFYRAFYCGLVAAGRFKEAWQESLAVRGRYSRAASAWLRAGLDAALPLDWHAWFRSTRKNRQPPEWLNPSVLRASYPGHLAARCFHYKTARQLSLNMVQGGHLQMLLHWEDRNSMAYSIESRVPFLDYRLAEFIAGLPDTFKIRAGITKAVLRASMRGIVPELILGRRDKMGFVTPEEVWVKQAGTPLFKKALAEAVNASQGILTPAALGLFERMICGQVSYDSTAWRMICLGTWMRLFNVSL